MSRDPSIARTLWRLVEPIHTVTYFSPEPLASLKDAGYKGFWMGYFAGRSAPLGPVGPEVVFATFYNFSWAHVSRALPDAWTFAPPEAALAARCRGSVAALTRAFEAAGVADEVPAAAALAQAAADSAPAEGRVLFAANRSLPWPDEPIEVLWEAATRLREHRGDGHVAALASAGVGGREANVLQVAAGIAPREIYDIARHYDDTEWEALVAGLAERGLVDDAGTITPAGRALKADTEDRTDEAAMSAYGALDDEQLDRLVRALKPLAKAVVAMGELPELTPIGFRAQV